MAFIPEAGKLQGNSSQISLRDKPHAVVSAVFLLSFKITVLCNIAYFAAFYKQTSA